MTYSLEDLESSQDSEASYVLNREEVLEHAKSSLDFLAALALPKIYKYRFPPHVIAAWKMLIEAAHKDEGTEQIALGWPRGFSKTTLVKLFILYVILYTKRQFPLILANNESKALSIIADVMDMLKEPNIITTFGNYAHTIEIDRQDLKKFFFCGRDIVLTGLGKGGDPRGLNIKHVRPDIIICDDVQSRKDADSKVDSDSLETWLYGTVFKTASHKGSLNIFIANMYPTEYSILRRLKSNSTWIKFIAGGILADGTSLWEELKPIRALVAEYERDLASGHPEIFFAEVLNDDKATTHNLISLNDLPDTEYFDGGIATGKFIIIDPATGKLHGDDVAIGYFELYNQNISILRSVTAGKYTPLVAIEKALEFALTYNCRLILCESVAYQSTFLYWFEFICQQRGIVGIELAEIYPDKKAKTSRILNMFKELKSGITLLGNEPRALVWNEIAQFNALRADNVDNILDLLTYAPKAVAEFGELILSSNELHLQENDIKVLPYASNSNF